MTESNQRPDEDLGFVLPGADLPEKPHEANASSTDKMAELHGIRAAFPQVVRYKPAFIYAGLAGAAIGVAGLLIFAFDRRAAPPASQSEKTSNTAERVTPPSTNFLPDAISYQQQAASGAAPPTSDPATASPSASQAGVATTTGQAAPGLSDQSSQLERGPPTIDDGSGHSAGSGRSGGALFGRASSLPPTLEAARKSSIAFGGMAGALESSVRSHGEQGSPATPLLAPQVFPFPQPGQSSQIQRTEALAEVGPQNGQAEKRAFAASAAISNDYVTAKLEAPRSPFEIKAGSTLPVVLITALNSDLPGEIIGQVSQNVYDTVSGRFLLVPQGARVIGKYDSQVAYGQTRVLIAWRRIILPNGKSINLGSMAGADPTGATGVEDQVDNHWGQLAKGIVLSTFLSVGVSATQDAQARSSGQYVVNSAASGAASDVNSAGQRITNRDLNRQPTLHIRQGDQVRVMVDRDIILEPYRDAGVRGG